MCHKNPDPAKCFYMLAMFQYFKVIPVAVVAGHPLTMCHSLKCRGWKQGVTHHLQGFSQRPGQVPVSACQFTWNGRAGLSPHVWRYEGTLLLDYGQINMSLLHKTLNSLGAGPFLQFWVKLSFRHHQQTSHVSWTPIIKAMIWLLDRPVDNTPFFLQLTLWR